jgi:hypothetical protein
VIRLAGAGVATTTTVPTAVAATRLVRLGQSHRCLRNTQGDGLVLLDVGYPGITCEPGGGLRRHPHREAAQGRLIRQQHGAGMLPSHLVGHRGHAIDVRLQHDDVVIRDSVASLGRRERRRVEIRRRRGCVLTGDEHEKHEG